MTLFHLTVTQPAAASVFAANAVKTGYYIDVLHNGSVCSCVRMENKNNWSERGRLT